MEMPYIPCLVYINGPVVTDCNTKDLPGKEDLLSGSIIGQNTLNTYAGCK